MKTKDIFNDIFYIMVISIPSLIYMIPWIISTNPSLGVDQYGGGSILMNKAFIDVNRGYITDWYIGSNFALFPVKYIYWAILKVLSFLSSNPFTIIKLSFSITFFLSIITSYLTIKKIYNKKLYGILGSFLYVYAPYHMAWNGTEAIWSASLYYAILPLAFYYFLEFMMKLNIENKIDNVKLILSSLSLGLIVFTYPQSFLILTVPFLIVFSMLNSLFEGVKQKKSIRITRNILLSYLPIAIALLIGTFWWSSAMMQDDNISKPYQTIDFSKEKALSLSSIITLQGRAYTIPIFDDFFNSESEIFIAFLLGIIIWFAAIYSSKEVIKLLREKTEKNIKIRTWIPSAIISSLLFILLAMGPLSPVPIYNWLHDNVPFFSNIRAPDRWLAVIILSISFVFPSGVEIFSKMKILEKIPKIKFIGYCFIIVLILANTRTELSYAFKDFNLDKDIYQYYELLSHAENGSRILTIPMYQNTYELNKTGSNIETDRDPIIVDPRLWNFMYGEKENFLGGSESLSVREMGNFIDRLNTFAMVNSVNLNSIVDIYGIDYLWIDKQKEGQDSILFYYIDNSTTKLLETKNYVLYKNMDPLPRIFALNEYITKLDGQWKVSEGNGDLKLVSSNDSFELHTVFFDENVREWRYVKYEELTSLDMLDEIYGEYNISDVSYQSIELHLKFVDKNGKSYQWIEKFEKSDGSFRIPVFWFQPMDKNGTMLDVDIIKSLNIGISETFSDKKSKKDGTIEFKNLTILKHKLIDNVTYYKADDMLYNIDIPENFDSKMILIFDYAYNPNIKLKLNNTFIDSYKIFGFLNGFEVPYDSRTKRNNVQELGTIEYRLGKPYYYGMIISLMTIISLVGYILYNMIRNYKR